MCMNKKKALLVKTDNKIQVWLQFRTKYLSISLNQQFTEQYYKTPCFSVLIQEKKM